LGRFVSSPAEATHFPGQQAQSEPGTPFFQPLQRDHPRDDPRPRLALAPSRPATAGGPSRLPDDHGRSDAL